MSKKLCHIARVKWSMWPEAKHFTYLLHNGISCCCRDDGIRVHVWRYWILMPKNLTIETGQNQLGCVLGYFAVTGEWIWLTAAWTNWNFKFAQTAKYSIQSLQTVWKNVNIYYQHLLTFLFLFIIDAFVYVYYFWMFYTSV